MPINQASLQSLNEYIEKLSEPEEIARLLEMLTDEQLEAAVEAVGVDSVLPRVFEGMADHFVPEKATRYSGIIEWNIRTTEGKRAYHLKIEGGHCTYAEGAAPSPKVKMTTSLPLFLKMISGRVNGLQVYADGELEVLGDMVLAQMQQTFFDADLGNAELNVSTPRELARLIRGRTDEEIEAGVIVTGVDKALDMVFDGMVDHFLPAKVKKKRSVVKWKVDTPDGLKVYQFKVEGGRCSYGRGASEKANVSLSINLPDFLKVASGQLGGLVALAKGQIKVRGNILLARSIQSWFDFSK